MRLSSVLLAPLSAVVVLACACAPAVDPHSMSTASHERSARKEDAEAKKDQAQFDPDATVDSPRCSRLMLGSACWTSFSNPTEDHLRMADEHRHHAAEHRKASAVLRDAEAKSCAGVSDDDRDQSPFHHADDVLRVDVIGGSGKPETGVVVLFRAVPGMSEAGLQKVVDCHLARNAALGFVVPEMGSCPLVTKGARAKVAKTTEGFAVTIDADAPDAQKDIVARGRSLKK
jgi:hypothetical protein